jgi:hypothetical protein
VITPAGDVSVQAAVATTDATGFTSLEGVWYAVGPSGYTALPLATGWTNAPFSTRNAAVSVSGGIVRFQGAIGSSGTAASVFTLPVGMRPATNVYTPVDLCAGKKGRLNILPTGDVSVHAPGHKESYADPPA